MAPHKGMLRIQDNGQLSSPLLFAIAGAATEKRQDIPSTNCPALDVLLHSQCFSGGRIQLVCTRLVS